MAATYPANIQLNGSGTAGSHIKSGFAALTNNQIYNNTWVNESRRNVEINESTPGNGGNVLHHNL
jgi:hypothetical protein